LPHGGRGVVLHPTVRLGRDVTLFHRTTLGIREALDDGNITLAGDACGPVLGDGVYVGTGAAILGPIEIGERSKIGAGAVVLENVKPGTTVVGIPARGR
ncbi:MAG TPA: serine acetyltransferase, partial [Acidimicrobiia bacterium]|nr:serine acetyltransferase [Acidimicrobiia bacterium]